MKKHFLLSFLFLMVVFHSFSQKGTHQWTVSNVGTYSSCSYDVCLNIAIREIATQTVVSSEWVCHTIAPNTSATFMQAVPVSPATGYEIVVIGAAAAYSGGPTFTGMSLVQWTNDVRFGSCSGGPTSNWVTRWERTGTYSFTICESLIVG